MTPADYIRRFRLSKSALMLRDEACKILDVALELGFGSVDGYQRAFLREFGCNPRQYAATPIPLYLFTPYGVKYQAVRKEKQMENAKSVFVQVIEKPARKVLIKRGIKAGDYFAYCEEVGCDVWGLLTSIKSISGEPVCLWLPTAYIASGTSEYVQGVEVDQQTVEVVVHFKIIAGILTKEYPTASAKHFNISFVVKREQINNQIPQRFLTANPRHKAVYTPSPPSGSR